MKGVSVKGKISAFHYSRSPVSRIRSSSLATL
jgi:hypothetical protein